MPSRHDGPSDSSDVDEPAASRVDFTVQLNDPELLVIERSDRSAAIRALLEAMLEAHPEVTPNWSSTSPSALTVECSADVSQFNTAVEQLEADGLRVDAAYDQQIVDE